MNGIGEASDQSSNLICSRAIVVIQPQGIHDRDIGGGFERCHGTLRADGVGFSNSQSFGAPAAPTNRDRFALEFLRFTVCYRQAKRLDSETNWSALQHKKIASAAELIEMVWNINGVVVCICEYIVIGQM